MRNKVDLENRYIQFTFKFAFSYYNICIMQWLYYNIGVSVWTSGPQCMMIDLFPPVTRWYQPRTFLEPRSRS